MELEAHGHAVRISHPDKVCYPEFGLTKLDLARYYLAVAEGALRGIHRRPLASSSITTRTRRIGPRRLPTRHAGAGDAPWPPHFAKGESEGPRVAPSRARRGKAEDGSRSGSEGEGEDGVPAPRKSAATGRRKSAMPLIVIARSWTKEGALGDLERWKAKHLDVAAKLAEDDVLVDGMRGRSSRWYRVRINLRHVPEAERPAEEVDPDEVPQDPQGFWHAKRPAKKAAMT